VTDRRVAARCASFIASIVAVVALVASAAPATETGTAIAPSAPGDPLESADCRRALATLSGEEAAVAAMAHASGVGAASERRGVEARLAPARREAATACLASRADPPTLPQRLVRPPPVAVAPLAVAPTSAPTPASARAASPAPFVRPADKPFAITSCDPGGCWANDGSRLNRVGPNLWGPHGICTVQGSLVQCP
jgi:hypothetical protein